MRRPPGSARLAERRWRERISGSWSGSSWIDDRQRGHGMARLSDRAREGSRPKGAALPHLAARNVILPTTVSGSSGTLAEMVKSQRPAMVSGALNAYTPGSGLGSGTIAAAMLAIPSGVMSIRVCTIAASLTGFWLALWTRRTATVATLLVLMSALTGSNA